MKIELLESEIESVIFNEQLLLSSGIKCIQRQVRFGSAGIVDILGYDIRCKRWVIIEIKKDDINAKTLAQAERYKKWLTYYIGTKMEYRGCRPPSCNAPYSLLIGDNLSNELRYLNTIERRGYDSTCYTLFKVEPALSVNWRSNNQSDYDDAVDDEIEGLMEGRIA